MSTATRIDHGAIANITATHCCVCRIRLTDAESVEHGIGPICSRRYYNPLHNPTDEMVMSALGLLLISELPEHIIIGFRKLVSNNHTNARKACNLLVYWAACNYHDKTEVFKCSRIIRELGYVELADKLETDRTSVTIRQHPDRDTMLIVAAVSNWRLHRNMCEIPGCEDTATKEGRKYVWNVPSSERTHLNIVLGIYLGGKLACGLKKDGTTGVWKIQRKSWIDLNRHKGGKQQGVPDPNILEINGDTILVRTPYNVGFLTALKNAIPHKDRKWNPVEKRWEVSEPYKNIVKTLILAHYGISV